MKFRNNEQGSTLLIVLLLIAVFTILGLALLSMNTTATKQFNQKEEQVQARHLAEMGLLHYKAEIKEIIKNYTFVRGENENIDNVLERSQVELCQRLLEIEVEKEVFSDIKGEYVVKRDSCGATQDEKLELKLNSEGKVNETVITISASATFTPPTVLEVDENTGIPSKPDFPVVNDPKDELPDQSEVDLVVNGPITTQKETQHFKGSLVINKAPNDNDKTFKVKGGNRYDLTVDKNLYISGDFDSQNHSCIVVKENLTILGTSDLGNKTVIMVYGNAHFVYEPELHSNSQIYVAGNTYLGTPAEKTTDYKSIPDFEDCKKPEDFIDPYDPLPKVYKWGMEDGLNPVYK